MFSQSNEETKLDWIYKGSTVDREEYLLGRKVDKALDDLNASEKAGPGLNPPKNHVEHECIPPSIRDYKLQNTGEQVDLAQKLQEDPLVAIKRREEESRKQVLQNPVQLKKLQALLVARKEKKRKKKKKKRRKSSDSSDSEDLDEKLKKKLLKLKGNLDVEKKGSKSLDKLLLLKFSLLKDQLSENDLNELKNIKSESKRKNKRKESSSSDEVDEKPKKQETSPKASSSKRKLGESSKSYRNKEQKEHTEVRNKHRKRSSSTRSKSSNSEEADKPYGLIHTESSRKTSFKTLKPQSKPKTDVKSNVAEHTIVQRKRLSEEDKERRRREMMDNATWRDREREGNMKRYREDNRKEEKQRADYNPEFLKRELLKSANNSTVESRIKSNINNIQRSRFDMEKHFSRRN